MDETDVATPEEIISSQNVAAHEISDDDDDDEEEECRVCRGPAEEGRPLYAPCKCSGSIGLTHQDCLSSWLEVTRGDGRCELCKIKFRFAPRYADGTPNELPPYEVLLGLLRRALAKWLPFGLRAVLAASLWLCALPLATSYLFHGWMHRPSAIITRWKWDLVAGDAVSGAVVAAVIIVSFLSLMSFADFLRFHWQQRAEGRQGGQDQLDADRPDAVEDGHLDPLEDGIDDGFLDHDAQRQPPGQDFQDHPETGRPDTLDRNALGVMDERQPLYPERLNQINEDPQHHAVHWLDEVQRDNVDEVHHPGRAERDEGDQMDRREIRRRVLAAAARRRHGRQEPHAGGANHDDEVENADLNFIRALDPFGNERQRQQAAIPPLPPDEDELEQMMRAQEEQEMHQEDQDLGGEQNQGHFPQEGLFPDDADADAPPVNDNDRFEPQFEPLQPAFDQDDGMDMEIHVALDELLGLRGPLFALIRNLLWLLAFNTTYLGLFAFIPHTIGESVYSTASNSTLVSSVINRIPSVPLDGERTFVSIIHDINTESKRLNTSLQLPDVATIALGYLSMAFMVFFWKGGLSLFKQFRKKSNQENGDHSGQNVQARVVNREERLDMHRARRDLFQDNLDGEQDIFPEDEDEDEFEMDPAADDLDGMQNDPQIDVRVAVGQRLSLALDCAVAIVKVGVLLFLKMLLLPLLLGIWLDASTLSLFGSSIDDRVLFAGKDLFGSILLHWVAGITFMLIVTVSVLQLREVAHPDLLARVIRPQEPQPDLLGNLLQESGATHAKRMLLSLGIYAALLSIHVWLPAHLLVALGIGKYLPFFRPKFWFLLIPQLQVPVELMIFHLSMLAFLEKYKNHIGEIQHYWLIFMCRWMGLTEHVLPREVEKFELVGFRPVFIENVAPASLDNVDEGAGTDSTSASSTDDENRKIVDLSPIRQSEDGAESFSVDPFWRELISTKTDPTDEFIMANIQQVSSIESPQYEVGTTKRNGKRVLDSSKSFIKLPPRPYNVDGSVPPPPFLDSASSSDNSANSTSSDPNLLPTTIGAYRLRRRANNKYRRRGETKQSTSNDSHVVEFWREVAGKPISRPPEGWDDLGVGGAEVQGRWAWSNERKSEIEESVARRTNFVQTQKGRTIWSLLPAVPLLLKMALLFSLSWLATMIVACAAMSGPLFVGRFVFFLLRVSDSYIHDSLGFVIGGGILFPIIGKLGQTLGGGARTERSSFGRTMLTWAASFRRPGSIQKTRILGQAIFLWFIILPLFLGVLYDLCLVKSRSWFAGKEALINMTSLLLSWGTGTLLLNVWAALCYVGAFTKQFWALIGVGIGGANALNNQNDEAGNAVAAVAADRENDVINDAVNNDRIEGLDNNDGEPNQNGTGDTNDSNRQTLMWQGQHGRIRRSFEIVWAVLQNWEWDKVDGVMLLKECTMPIARQLSLALLSPLLAYLGFLTLYYVVSGGRDAVGIVLPFFGFVDKGVYQMFLFRSFAFTVIAIQLAVAFQYPLQKWFQAAHRAARDDRYLVGETLMNHVVNRDQ